MAGPSARLARAADRVRARPWAVDAGLAAGFLAGETVLLTIAPPTVRPEPWSLSVLASAVCAVPIALRRTAFRIAVALAVATLVGPALLNVGPFTQSASFLILTYTAAARMSARPAVAAWLALWLPVLGRTSAT
jgi:hypothetical protein